MTPPRTRLRRSVVSGAIIPLACVAGAVAGAFGVGVGASPAAAARIEVGVYQDNPVAGVPALTRTVGRRSTRVISTYVTGGKLVEPSVVALARRTHARLLVSWMPDGGKEGAKQPRFKLSRVRRGAQNRGLVALTKQLRGLKPAADPAPDAGAQHALVRLVGHGQRQHARPTTWRPGSACARPCGTPAARGSGCCGRPTPAASRRRPRTRSRPTSPAPRRSIWSARAATTSARTGGLAWTEPAALFEDAYARSRRWRRRRSGSPRPARPRAGGNKAQWIATLGDAADRDPEPGRRRLVRRPGPQRRLPHRRRRRRRASPSRNSSSRAGQAQ